MSIHVFSHEAMATHFEVAIDGPDREYARQAAAATFREADRLEQLLSRYIESSDISRANLLARGDSTMISDETLEVLLISADLTLATQRAFDPAYKSRRPVDLPADAPLYLLDPENHRITSQADRLHLDLGAVGKGFALDRMADILREWGLAAACLNAGGSSVLALETPPVDGPLGWSAGLGEGAVEREIPLLGASLSGSGTAVKGAHLFNPRTGGTAARLTRVWALAPNAAQADALSTAFFVMEVPEVAALCSLHPQIGAALTQPDGTLQTFGALAGSAGT
jgi:thiamine biosynthesis lipoprotein